MLYGVLHTLVVYAESVDDSPVLRYSEASWPRISILRLGSEGTNLYKAESKVGKVIIVLSILIKSTCKAYWIREVQTEYLPCKLRTYLMNVRVDMIMLWAVSGLKRKRIGLSICLYIV